MLAPSIVDIVGPRIQTRPVAGLPLIHVETPRYSKGQRFAKRSMELVVAWVSGAIATSSREAHPSWSPSKIGSTIIHKSYVELYAVRQYATRLTPDESVCSPLLLWQKPQCSTGRSDELRSEPGLLPPRRH